MSSKSADKRRWWKEAVIYQIYPASFLDKNGDGWGDLRGIIEKLDYLKNLGVDIIWCSPICKSPQADMGYDISDYKDIDPRYGTLEDVDKLISEMKKRDMKLMMDLVVNHTSIEHAWFVESRSSRNNPKRDWYIWKDPKRDEHGNPMPPNNWGQILGEANSAWSYDAHTEQYYLTLFTPAQPDLNWENPEVVEAVHDVMKFWLERGACGFRMDVINLISKVQTFPDAKVTIPDLKYQPGFEYFANGPRLHEFLKGMNHNVLRKYDAVTVGEMPWVRDEEEILKVVGAEAKELNMIFIFELVDIDNAPDEGRMAIHQWQPKQIRDCINRWQTIMPTRDGWNSLFCENHDNPRSVSRFTDDSDEFRDLGAKLLCLMQVSLCGTLYIFQGEELGMRNIPLDWGPEEYKDVESVNFWKKINAMYPNDQEKLSHGRLCLQRKARDNSRTPMQWNSSKNSGFCSPDVTPWMRVNDDYVTVNADAQLKYDGKKDLSVWQFWKKAVSIRKSHSDTLVYGSFELVDPQNEDIFAYVRSNIGEKWIVVLNFNNREIDWEIPNSVQMRNWVLGNYSEEYASKPLRGKITVRPWEGLWGECNV